MKIALYANGSNPRAMASRKAVADEALRLGIAVVGFSEGPDVVVGLGGDGTMLRAVREHAGVPVVGFNFGGLGYLSAVGPDDFSRALAALAAGNFRVSERTMLSARKGDSAAPAAVALNDVVAVRERSGHAAVLELAADGRPVTRYLSDGLVVATPTGSTAYSLSAGGPVMMPDTGAIVVTPMNPHALAVRPIVCRDTVRISVTSRRRTNGEAEPIGVYADGETVFALGADETLEVTKAAQGALLVELDGYDPCGTLAKKLGWSGMHPADTEKGEVMR